MKYRILLILSLLSFAAARPGPVWSPYYPENHRIPIFVPDGLAIFTSEGNESRINDLRIITKNKYPIQIGAFRTKKYAEIMFSKVYPVLGEDVTMIEEDDFYKIQVTRIKQEKRGNYTAVADNPEVRNKESDTTEVRHKESDTLFNSQDTNRIAKIKADTLLSAAASPDTEQIFASGSDTTPAVTVQAKKAVRRFFFINSESPWLKRVNYFGKSFAFVNALIITIFLSIVTMVILLVVILYNRTRMEKEEKLHQYLSETYQGMIVDFLFTEGNPDRFFEIASTGYRRQVLIDQMIDVSINLKGDTEKKLQNLYLSLGLDKDSIKRAYDFRWHKKIKGFRELAFMNIKDANPAINKALNSRNEILRMEAQTALVRLSDLDPFGFLYDLKRPFSLWEQITLHDLIIQHELPVPSFKKYLQVTNPTVVMFALRMIREFKQRDAEDDIREIMEHRSSDVRHLAVQVAGDLDMRSTLDVMKRIYKNQDYKTCLEIVKSMGKMPDPSLLGFLQLVLDKEDDVQLQIEATKAIENNGEEGVKMLVKLMKSEYKNYNIIVRHVLDRRIY